ncbi:hypothetical protein ABZS93_08830 [Streptomyces sp900116325]|uniref:hypothetical protein n=1 Tax=Streptomyces sp. 900116325 TaxID=3154295 RepID=UPI0033A488E5
MSEAAGDSEDEAAAALEVILHALSQSEGRRVLEEPSAQVIVDVQEWASLASYAVARTYAPQSPLRYAGFSRRVTQLLVRIVTLLTVQLNKLGHILTNPTFSISINFPWGVSSSVSWI